MVRNLVENAIAYAGSGAEATIRLHVARDIVLEVADNGNGIPPNQLASVRKRFVRHHNDKSGAGLGLPIVEEIAQLFGGTLELQSAAGEGFRSVVRFPVPSPVARVGIANLQLS
jgi:two-component system sensor histidine kinase TctE